eukprot:Opistho-1_new@24573
MHSFATVDALAEPWGAALGLPVDQFKYLLCLVLAYPLGFAHKGMPSPAAKHVFSIACGLLFGLFCFGTQMVHPIVTTVVTYALTSLRLRRGPQVVFAFNLLYLSACHIYRQVTDYGGYRLDVTGPLMILCVKLSSLAYNLEDGRRPEKCSEEQKRYALTELPSLLEYFGFAFFFSGFLAGPSFEIRDYIEFSNTPSELLPRDTATPAARKFVAAVLCMGVFMLSEQNPIEYMRTDEFLYERPLYYRLLYILIAADLKRYQYYFAWTLADGACNAAGLGYSPDKAGQPQWNGVSNVDIIKLETAQSFKEVTDNWNINTSRWLRRYVYLRLAPEGSKPTFVATMGTYLTSAFWHGFYPGYYLMFVSSGFLTHIARDLRRHLRPHVVNADGTPKSVKPLYDFAGWLLTQFSLNYVCSIFVLLTVVDAYRVWKSVYFCVHVVLAVLMVFYSQRNKRLAQLSRGSRPSKAAPKGE